ncbi:MAG: hypothetical protein D6773_03180, partial [Alphaproteobacteria bacterium]
MVKQEWIICGAEFIEGDVIRWQEGVFENDRHNWQARVRIGQRINTAQVERDPDDLNTMMVLRILTSEGTRAYKAGEMIRRARHTCSGKDTERLAWSDEDARAAVIDSLPEAQRKAIQVARIKAREPWETQPPRAGAVRSAPVGATGAPWTARRRRVG